MSKYNPLSAWLHGQTANSINATVGTIERVLGFALPNSAGTWQQWWENDPNHAQAKAWLAAGYNTKDVHLTAENLAFVRS
jgi:hypothetical protein